MARGAPEHGSPSRTPTRSDRPWSASRARAPSRPTFEEIVGRETDRDPDLAVIEAGSRTLRAQAGPPQADIVPGRPEDPETDRALREVEAELATRWAETKLDPSRACASRR